jgi:methylated-DNA-protein-cysteine methyltransferase-like protein
VLYLYVYNKKYKLRLNIDKDRFRKAVYDVVCCIPRGRATSYGAIAKAIGYPNMSRLVGNVMGECDSLTSHIPAHRVVNSQGVLSAKAVFGNPLGMQSLLEQEGITVLNNTIVNWKTVFWDPLSEINID